jgi:hypothetical protein
MSEDNKNVERKIESEEGLKKVLDEFKERGMENGKEVAEVLKERGHDNAMPLYRSAIIIDKSDRGIEFRTWSDPIASGEDEISEETLPEEPVNEFLLTGTRWGGRMYRKLPNDEWEEMFALSIAKEVIDDIENEEED